MPGQDNKRKPRKKESEDGLDSRVLKLRRVSRMYHGGRRMRFSAFVVVGDKQGKVGVATAKSQDVAGAQDKAAKKARRNIVNVNLKGNTIPHRVEYKFKSSKVLLMPAAPGTGIVAGATVKAVVELAGVKDVLTKIVGSTNPINTATAAVKALESLKRFGKQEKEVKQAEIVTEVENTTDDK